MDLWKDAKLTLATVAPMLASAVGGPLAGAATNAVINALALAPDTTAEQAATAVVGANADQLIALQNADKDFKAKMGQLQLDADKLTYGDRADARARETALKDHAPAVLAMVITVGFFSLLVLMAFRDLPAANVSILNIMLGSLGAGFTMVLSYYYGASIPPPAPAPKQ